MKKIIHHFFMALGVLFFLILLALTAFIIIDPYNLKPLWQTYTASQAAPAMDGSNEPSSQAEALEAAGLSAEDVMFTPAEEECFIDLFGQERVNEIKAGAIPSAQEILRGQGCL